MKYQITGYEFEENKFYYGVITKVKEIEDRLLIYVKFKRDPENRFLKSITIDTDANSPFTKMAKQLGIIDEDQMIDTDLLEGLYVKATLQYAKNEKLYVNKISVNHSHYEKLNESKEGE